VREIGGIRVLATELTDASAKDLRSIVDELKQRLGSGSVLLAARQDA
jgi:alanyl-tRNA synthetase